MATTASAPSGAVNKSSGQAEIYRPTYSPDTGEASSIALIVSNDRLRGEVVSVPTRCLQLCLLSRPEGDTRSRSRRAGCESSVILHLVAIAVLTTSCSVTIPVLRFNIAIRAGIVAGS